MWQLWPFPSPVYFTELAKTASYEDVLRGLSRVPALQSGEDCVTSQKNVCIEGYQDN